MKHLAFVSLFSFATLAPAQSDCRETAGFDAIVDDMVATLRLGGAALRLDQHGQPLHDHFAGRYDAATRVPIASATKWLSAAVLMSCVDSGHLQLDDTVARWVPSFRRPDKIAITLRQCFAHISGLPADDPIVGDRSVTLEQATDFIAQLPMVVAPGTAFNYGGVSMHAVGRACEIATGKSWAQLFGERIATPLGLTDTDYYGFGFTLNPRIGGGAASTLRDYARFVEMLRADGLYGTTRVLRAASVAEMFADLTSGLPVIHSPHPTGAPYGIGTWLEQLDAQGRPQLVSTAGAFGFSAWVDLDRGAGGTLAVFNNVTNVIPYVQRLFAEGDRVLLPVGATCVGTSTAACAGPVRVNTDRLPRADGPATALAARAAPPSTSGALLLAAAADAVGTPLLDIRVHLLLAPPPLLVTLSSDPDGNAAIALPMIGIAAGTRFAGQFVFLNTATCGGALTLSSSHAIEVIVQPR